MNLFLVLQTVLIALLVLALGVFVSFLFIPGAAYSISSALGVNQKADALEYLGIGAAGVLVALHALMSYKRARQMEAVASAQANAAVEQARATAEQARSSRDAEQGRRHLRLHNGVEHLGHESAAVRLGGAYELFHLAEDTESLRQPVLDILCSHIRRTTGQDTYRRRYRSNPSEEVQSLLSLLFASRRGIFNGLQIDLQGSWLNGATLCAATLCGANLAEARLQGADLVGAQLQGADLSWAYLQVAGLSWARLQGADLVGARLDAASLSRANLHGADLARSTLRGAALGRTHLQGAFIVGAHLQGADLAEAQFQGVRSHVDYPDSFVQRIKESIGEETDLSGAVFGGGLTHEEMESILHGMHHETANDLREKLTPHVGNSTSYELPEHSGAVIGAYTEEDAEKWIAEYREATGEAGESRDEAKN
ncbi:MAG: pentapeptide repeat-containing protein [Gemmatimonadota bacterium]|nr:pentapeptide repeat-containing protein [Gemmatimonadota bacterium]